MKFRTRLLIGFAISLSVFASATGARMQTSAVAQSAAVAQGGAVVLTGADLTRVVPPGFYFEGQSAPTQLRNAAAARFGRQHHVIAGLVDTSGYSSDIQAKYQGFFITDAPVSFQDGSVIGTGAYGFGFTETKFNIYDVGGRQLLSIEATSDRTMLRPRPLMMVKKGDRVLLYGGRTYVELGPRVEVEL